MDLEVIQGRFFLRDLITPIVTARQIAFCLDSKNPEQTGEAKEKIIIATEQSLRQIHDLERLARILQAGEVDTTPVDIRAVCEEIREETREFFNYYNKRLKLRVFGRPKLVVADRELLSSVLYNFVTDGVNYSAENGELYLNVFFRTEKVCVELRDFGPIIPAALGVKIQEKRLDGQIKIPFRPDVSGLRLYTNVKFLEMMGSGVKVQRHRDGMSFLFELKTVDQGRLF